MCIIAVQKEGQDRITKETFARCRDKNPHGIGMMWAKGGDLNIWRTLDDFNGFWNRYTSIRDEGRLVAIHFRAASVGEVSLQNVHPFYIGRPGVFAYMHNGTFSELGKIPEGVSDTHYFRNEVLDELPPDFLSRTAWREMVKKFIGSNRLVFMDRKSNYSILNESYGDWYDVDESQVWFSNSMWKATVRSSRTTGYWDDEDTDAEKTWCAHCGRMTDHSSYNCPKWEDTYAERSRGKEVGVRQSENSTDDRQSGGKEEDGTDQCDLGIADDSKELPENERAFLVDHEGVAREVVNDVVVTTEQGGLETLRIDELEHEVCHQGILYEGLVTCWSCLPSPQDYDPQAAVPIPTPMKTKLICRGCEVTVFDPERDTYNLHNDGGYFK